MRAPSELQLLAELRSRGQAPELPVWITNNATMRVNLTAAGMLAIPVRSDDWELDWSALAGLDVVLAVSFIDTPVGTRLAVAIRDAQPRRLRLWLDDPPHWSTMLLAPCAPMERAA